MNVLGMIVTQTVNELYDIYLLKGIWNIISLYLSHYFWEKGYENQLLFKFKYKIY